MLAALLALTLFSAPIVCIDPGHPSEVGAGTTGKKISELHAVWIVAKALETRLKKAGYQVVLTKSKENELVTNKHRAEIANNSHANLMVRLHCDAEGSSGFGVYYPDQSATVQGHSGPTPEVLQHSAAIAKIFYAEMKEKLEGKHPARGLMTDRQTAIGAKQGALTGSIFSNVPVVLVEMAVLTNARDDKFMASRKGQTLLTEALFAAIARCLSHHPTNPKGT